MTFRLEKDALKYSDMNYIVDSGASTFNSKGFSLYTVQGNLRADIAVADQENCLQIPVTVNKWQDILVTWRKSEGNNGYVSRRHAFAAEFKCSDTVSQQNFLNIVWILAFIFHESQYHHTLIENDHQGDWRPEKDCCCRLTLRQPVRKLSTESSGCF